VGYHPVIITFVISNDSAIVQVIVLPWPGHERACHASELGVGVS